MDIQVETVGSVPSPEAATTTECPGGFVAVSSSSGTSVFPTLPVATEALGAARLSLADVAGDVLYSVPHERCAEARVHAAALSRPAPPRVVTVAAERGDAVAVLAALRGVRLPGAPPGSAAVAACTHRGAVSLLHSRGAARGVAVFRDVAQLGVRHVVAADTSVPGYVAFAALRGKRLGIHVLKVGIVDKSASEDADAELDVEVFDIIWAPTLRKSGAAVVSFALQPHAAYVSYSSGELDIFSPRNGYSHELHAGTLEAWRESYDPTFTDDSDPVSGGEAGVDRDRAAAVGKPVRDVNETDHVSDVSDAVPGESAGKDTDGDIHMDTEQSTSCSSPNTFHSKSANAKGKNSATSRRDGTVVASGKCSQPSGPIQKRPQMRAYVYKAKYSMTLRGTLGSKDKAMGDDVEQPKRVTMRGGMVSSTAGGYAVVGYGQIVSLWDGEYGTGHAFVDLSSDICNISTGGKQGQFIVVVASGAVLRVTVDGGRRKRRVSLADALKNQAVCRPIVSAQHSAPNLSRTPLHSHPVAVAALKATADAGSSGGQFLEPHLKGEDKEETGRLRKILRRELTSTAGEVSDAMELYVFGNVGERSARIAALSKTLERQVAKTAGKSQLQLGLSRLPSERLAATVVARCLLELEAGNVEFCVPLIDMLCSGVVSADFVLVVMSDMIGGGDSSWSQRETGSTPSLTTALMQTIDTSYAFEALLMRVSDVSECDVVRALQFGVRQREQAVACLGYDGVEGAVRERDNLIAAAAELDRRRVKREKKLEERKANGVPKKITGNVKANDVASAEVRKRQAVRAKRRAESIAQASSVVEERKAADLALVRANRLIARSIATSLQDNLLVAAMRRMPAHDVLAVLRYCSLVLNDDKFATEAATVVSTAERKRMNKKACEVYAEEARKRSQGKGAGASESAKRQSSSAKKASMANRWGRIAPDLPSDYVGDLEWVNEPLLCGAKREDAGFTFQVRCTELIGRLIEAHMATLVMDEAGVHLVRDLLSTVRSHRKRTEAVSPLLGMVSHLKEGMPLPTRNDPLYSATKISVPSFAALL